MKNQIKKSECNCTKKMHCICGEKQARGFCVCENCGQKVYLNVDGTLMECPKMCLQKL